MKEISKEVKSLNKKKESQLCSRSWAKQIKHRNEQTERTGDFFFIPLTYGERINLKKKKTVGKFNSVFIAASVCTGSKYYLHASRTSNNTISLLMTKTKWTPVNIISFHPWTVCSQLHWRTWWNRNRNVLQELLAWQKPDLIKGEN